MVVKQVAAQAMMQCWCNMVICNDHAFEAVPVVAEEKQRSAEKQYLSCPYA